MVYRKTRSALETVGAIVLFLSVASFSIHAQQPAVYTADWASLDKHVAAPEWFKDAKLGIYFHWGLYSVPNHASEWYGTYMYNNSSEVSGWHSSNLGDQWGTDSASNWGYDKFATGKTNKAGVRCQFAPKLKSAGGNFDPQEFANVLDSAGAWYAGPVTMHHDGFAMWNSSVTEWCAGKMGPKLDLVKLLTDAFRTKNMKIVTSFHHAYRQGGFWANVPKQTNPSLQKFYAQRGKTIESQFWYDAIKEVVDAYQPDVIWHDFGLYSVDNNQVLSHLAYYYNQAIGWKKDVTVCYKNTDMHQAGEIKDYECNTPTDLDPIYWQSDDGSNKGSWAYKDGLTYWTVQGILHCFIDRVSKNGNLLMNFGPKPDGSIPDGAKTVLYGLGAWLHKFGETIYCTRAFSVYGEGPTKWGNPSKAINPTTIGTSSDIRYTISKDKKNLFAIFLGWPSGTKTLTGVTAARFNVAGTPGAKVYLYGTTPETATSLTFTQGSSGLQVTFPSSAPYSAFAYPIKISLTGEAPKGTPKKTWDNTGLVGTVNNNVAAIIQTQIAMPMAKIFVNGNGAVALTVPAHATGVTVYSLQGKKCFSRTLDDNQRVCRFEGASRLSAGTFFVKFSKE